MLNPTSRFNLIKINSIVVRERNKTGVLLYIIAENEVGETFEDESWCDEYLYLKLLNHDVYTERFFLDMIGNDAKTRSEDDYIV